ncbi:MAG: nucleotidyl transferase AbiEii/AbiGii toxin family protein [Selenomonadaceae bacterium]|nr:nucleotidyl transferase AbiEii/AbiGii toxin family protein [Selenomonadaceae bacterium]
MQLREMMGIYAEDGLSANLAAARVCQDVVLKAIADGPLSRNVTIKGGVVMRSMTDDIRRATRDIDLDLIHYSIEDAAIELFVSKMNSIPGLTIEIAGPIEELKHQDYHGKSIKVRITDETGYHVESKIDIGVHKHLELTQEEYCFDVCMDENGASLLKNSKEQALVEKLRALLIFGQNNRRYKDIYDIYYLKDFVDINRLREYIRLLIFDDEKMREQSMADIVHRVESAFRNKKYLRGIASSRQRWIDEDVSIITGGIVIFLNNL